MKLNKLQIVFILATALMFGGCVFSRYIVDLGVDTGVNPQGDNYVTIVSVTDSRKFELRPKELSIPSLKDGQINNSAITSRAIARQSGSEGEPLGDILLPEGRTVADVVKEVVTKAFRERGYVVVEKGSPAFGKATSLFVDIREFWCWCTIDGLWCDRHFRAFIRIEGTNLFSDSSGRDIFGVARIHSGTGLTRVYVKTLNKGVEDLAVNIKAKLKNP